MYRRAMSLVLLAWVPLALTAALGHAHPGRPHVHLDSDDADDHDTDAVYLDAADPPPADAVALIDLTLPITVTAPAPRVGVRRPVTPGLGGRPPPAPLYVRHRALLL